MKYVHAVQLFLKLTVSYVFTLWIERKLYRIDGSEVLSRLPTTPVSPMFPVALDKLTAPWHI